MLIKCPECNKQISDKAISCPSCGFPIGQNKNLQIDNTLYIIKFKKFINHKMYSKNRMSVWGTICNISISFKDVADCINRNLPTVIFDGVTKTTVDVVKKYFSSCGCVIDISKSQFSEINEYNDLIFEKISNKFILKCPRCGSLSITTGQRGFTITTGFLGSNRTVNRCGNCGYFWKP